MKRISIDPRSDWQKIVESQGFTFHSMGEPSDGIGTYWYEGSCYEFTLDEINLIETATADLHQLCLKAVERVANDRSLLDRFGIPKTYHDLVHNSWNNHDPYLYGRFDLAFDGEHVKLLEYNADTPTTLVETGLVQWYWLQDRFPEKAKLAQQFNSLDEKLVERFGELRRKMPANSYMHMSAVKLNLEEFATVEYLRDCAYRATPRLDTEFTHMEDIEAIDGGTSATFRDQHGYDMQFWFKLYPWEWLWKEPHGKYIPRTRMGILEPPWKAILSNKAILAILWEMFPGHPNLLPAFFSPHPELGDSFIEKPFLGREGGNMKLTRPNGGLETDGAYAASPRVFQKLAEISVLDGYRAIIGSWIVGDKPAGMILREDQQEIIIGTSRVVPHYYTEAQ